MNNTEVAQASRAQPAPERPSRSGWKRLVKASALVVALLLAYLAFWPAPIDPVAYEPPPNPPLAGPLTPNDRLQSAVIVAAGQVDGPEDVEVDAEGRIYTGTADGWIVRVEPDGSVTKFAKTGGRPLGIALDAQGNLIVADGVKGLLSIAPDKTVTTLVTKADGVELGFTDDLDVAQDGTVYFSDASNKFGPGEYLYDMLEGRPNGRLLRYSPATKQVEVLLRELYFANGVALSQNEDFVLVNETYRYRVTRYWLKGERAGTSDTFIDNLPGYPDNITSNRQGTFWLALFTVRNDTADWLAPKPFVKQALSKLPSFLWPKPQPYAFVVKLDETGAILDSLQDPTGQHLHTVTSAQERDGYLYLGSLHNDRIGKYKLPDVATDAQTLQPPEEPNADRVGLIQRTDTPDRPAIDTAGFRDGAHHWRKIRDTNRVIQPLPDQAAYAPSQVHQILGNILLFQRDNGGWPKDYDLLAILTPEQTAAIQATRDRTDTSFDNHNIHSQVDYLARAYASDGDSAWRDACLRGFDFMLAAQLESGGFPQRYPDPSGYAAHITFNDGVMIGILNVLKDASGDLPHWKWLDTSRRRNARQAVARGIECILKCQIHAGGVRTGWCQQHDEKTYEAASARTFELASCCPQDTTEIMRFLMRSEAPSEEIVAAVDAAAEWLRQVMLTGIRVKKVPAPVEDFLRHRADFDVVVVEETGAPPVWARHYEIGTDRPVFAGRDAVKRYALAEIERERRTGTLWYGDWPRTMLDKDHPNWRSKLAHPR